MPAGKSSTSIPWHPTSHRTLSALFFCLALMQDTGALDRSKPIRSQHSPKLNLGLGLHAPNDPPINGSKISLRRETSWMCERFVGAQASPLQESV